MTVVTLWVHCCHIDSFGGSVEGGASYNDNHTITDLTAVVVVVGKSSKADCAAAPGSCPSQQQVPAALPRNKCGPSFDSERTSLGWWQKGDWDQARLERQAWLLLMLLV